MPAERKRHPMRSGTRRPLMVLRTLVGVGLLVYLSVSGAIDWSALLGLAKRWPVSSLALILLFAGTALTSWRLCLLLSASGMSLSLVSSVRLTLIGAFFSALLPGSYGGDVVRIYYATERNPGRRTEITTILLLDRALGLFALLLLPLLVAPLFPALLASSRVLRILLLSAASIAALMVLVLGFCLTTRGDRALALTRFLPKPLDTQVIRMRDTLHGYRMNVGTLFTVVGISLVVQALIVAVTMLIAQATSYADERMLMLIPLGFLANALPLTPGGLGVGEAAFDQLFASAGLAGGAEAILGWRVLTTCTDLIGLGCYIQKREPLRL